MSVATATVSPTEPGPVLGVVGWSGSGKTSLLEQLIGRLAGQGMRVNVVKHSHHDIELEPPRKDSARLRMAGAAEVMIASPYRVAILHELRGAAEPALAEHLARLAPADLTLVEGYKWERFPKLEVYRPAVGKPALYPDDADIVAVVSDAPRPEGLDRLAWLDLNDPDGVLAWLSQWMRERAKVPAGVAVKSGYASMGE
ncbi:molybdopterin-guanine dinucleotide biosynthesis protein B [Massilia consociata]|uniref:Molybdopterin-guanine dinucleotide biosynthesis protein B n=1 Tax=Massilia consociata TaxID=760117 RepID=A0ABV6FBJ4_9BURK